MAEAILLDNDILLKTACYGLDSELVALTTESDLPPSALSVSRFVIERRIQKSSQVADRAATGERFADLLSKIQMVDPTEIEVVLAAEFEAYAQEFGLELDSGESQLLAILLNRKLRLLLTGDKRAIRAIEAISAHHSPVENRIACFEQLIVSILAQADTTAIRECICSAPNADKAMSLCFCCSSAAATPEVIVAGLASYIGELRKAAPNALLQGDDLSGVIP